MVKPYTLELETADGRHLMHKYYPAAGDPSGLVLLLPGDHYGVDAPLLYYPALALRQQGWDTLAITYGYQSAGRPISLDEIPNTVDEVVRGLKAALAYRQPSRLLLIGKSLGAALITTLSQADPLFENARMIYLTPPLEMPFFASAFAETSQDALVILGTADRFYNEEVLDEMRSAKSFELMQIEGGDHSLNLGNDIKATLQVLVAVVNKMLAFAGN